MSNKVYICLIAVLLGVVGYMAYAINKKEKEVEYVYLENGKVMDEREGLEVELEAMRMKYDTMTVSNSTLEAERQANLEQITALQKKVKNRDFDIKKLQAEAGTLRDIMKNYIHQIDSLNTLSKQLAMERDQQTERADQAEAKGKELEGALTTTQDMVNKGAVLTAGEFANTPFFTRNSGKEIETDKANKTEGIKSCFKVRKNAIAKPGTRKLYMSIVGPDGKVLSGKNSGTISVGGVETAYSEIRDVDYQQNDVDVCIYYSGGEDAKFAKGNYKINIYESGASIGSSSVVMK
ncbi:MAG: hypothetical protein ACKVOK_04980 [Flavobacteriales bacterium]